MLAILSSYVYKGYACLDVREKQSHTFVSIFKAITNSTGVQGGEGGVTE